MELSRNLRLILGAMLASFLLSGSLFAQAGSGTLQGQVTDPSGAAVPAITVAVAGPGGAALVTQTDEQGRYAFHNLPPGTYTVDIRVKGFADFQKAGVVIVHGQTQAVDARLEVALEKQQVTVEGEANKVSVAAENNASALVIKGKDLEALSDDPDELQNELTALAGPSAGPNGGQIYIDGFTGGQLPPKSAIREIRVNQNPFSAQYDKLGYGRIEILTKPGTDHLHGQVFFNENDSALNSRNPFTTQIPSYHSEIYDGNIGGALSKKASFFIDVQRRQIQDAAIVNAVVPGPAPDFAATPFSQSVLTPQTRTNFSPRIDYQVSSNNTLTVRYHFWQNNLKNQGIGQFSLASLASNMQEGENSLQVSDSQVLSSRTVTEIRFEYERETSNETPLGTAPTINVPDAFVTGGSNDGKNIDSTNYYELQSYTSMSLGKHMLKFGGRLRNTSDRNTATGNFNGNYIFTTFNAYQTTQQGLLLGWTPAQIRAAGGGASQFSIVTGTPTLHVNYFDIEPYVEDDWRIKPNMTLNLGLRFETQNHIPDHADFAPRLGFAWGIDGGGKKSAKTVLRAGFGIFYDRFTENLVLNAARFNGITQQQAIITHPDFFPSLPSASQIAASATSPTVYQIDPNLRTPYTTQAGIGLERQVARNVTASVTYVNTHGVHQFLTNNINSPLPSPDGTYDPTDPALRPLGTLENIYDYQSVGLFNQNQVIANFRVNEAKMSLFGFYTLNYADGNTAGANTFPSNPYDIAADYGRAAFDVRHRLFVGGSYNLPKGFQIFPFMIASSGMPFNIYLNQNINFSTKFNQRPAFATSSTPPADVVVTKYGTFDIHPAPDQAIIPPNLETGPGRFSLNLRLSKTFNFGPETKGGGGGFGGGHWHGGGLGGRGLGSAGGGPFGNRQASNRRYNLTFSIQARNIFNNVNLASPNGVIGSPLFGESNAIVGGFFGSSAANRRIDAQVRFSF